MRIRKANTSDLNSIYKLGEDDFKNEGWFNKNTLKWVLETNPKLTWVLEDNKKIIGARLFCEDWGTNVWGWLIIIENTHRNNGLGKYLFDETCKKLKASGFERIMTDVSDKNKGSIKWHVKMGYKKNGFVKHWFKKNEHAIIFTKDL